MIFIGNKIGEVCARNQCKGVMNEYVNSDIVCSCHIQAPCSKCEGSGLIICSECGEVINPKEVGLFSKGGMDSWVRLRTLDDLDKSRIDWLSSSHTHFSMKKTGVYPENITKEEVEEKVRGTFGGRFEFFGNGKFSYIAYTD